MTSLRTTIATAALLLAPAIARAAAPAPPAPRCATATMIRPSDGAIVTRTVCVIEPAASPRVVTP